MKEKIIRISKKILNSPAYIEAELYLRKKKGWNYSADFLEHSLQLYPQDLVYDDKSKLAQKLKKNKKVEKNVRKFRKTNKLASKYEIEFKRGDLFGSFHNATLVMDRFKGYITCTLIDTYDFKFEKNYLSITMFANNYAWYLQVKGASHKYKQRKFKKGNEGTESGAELPVVSRVDKYWRTWRNRAKSKRKKNAGWIMYDNLSIMSYSGLKSMTIMDMCKWNGDYLK